MKTWKRRCHDVDRKRNRKEGTERGRREEIERQINRRGNKYLIYHWLVVTIMARASYGGHIRVVVMVVVVMMEVSHVDSH